MFVLTFCLIMSFCRKKEERLFPSIKVAGYAATKNDFIGRMTNESVLIVTFCKGQYRSSISPQVFTSASSYDPTDLRAIT